MAASIHVPPAPALLPLRTRRIVVVLTMVAGAALIAATLQVERGSPIFYVAGFSAAVVWIVSALICRPIRWTGSGTSVVRQATLGVVVGVASFLMFLVGRVVGEHISVLAGPIDRILGTADAGPLVAVLALALVNAVAEELFFRDALLDVLGGRWASVIGIAAYVAVTSVAGNTALTLAALVMGVVWVAERRWTGGLTAPIVTHLVWSTLAILLFPR